MYKEYFCRIIPPFVAAVFFWLLLPLTLSAQQRQRFSVASFEADPLDLTAREGQYAQKDDNGALYAIIKVTSNAPDDDLNAFQFNFGNLYHKTVLHGDELWVYVQQNAKWVTIEREGYTPVRRYVLGTGIEAGKVYVMHLSVTATPVVKQMVQFHVQPAGVTAMIMVKGAQEGAVEEPFGTTDANGAAAKSLRLGTYNYRIVATDYYEANGQFVLKDRTKMHTENVTLRPKFANVTLQVNADADIYVDGELGGKRTWTGHLNFGTYTVECRQEHHRPTSQFITVREDSERTFQLQPPTPITGSLSIISRPLGAAIIIDGRDYGKTPRIIDSLLIGQHNFILDLDKYQPFSQNVEIKDNELLEVEPELFLNTSKEPRRPQISKDVLEYQKNTCGYILAGTQVGSLMGVSIAIGTYIKNFNIEAYFLYGLSKSEKIYWGNVGPFEYKPLSYGLKVGYGFTVLRTRLRLTPQVGMQMVSVKDSSDGETSNTHVIPFTIGISADYALTRHLGVYLNPQFNIAIKKPDIYGQLAKTSSTIKSWGTGFNASIGLHYSF